VKSSALSQVEGGKGDWERGAVPEILQSAFIGVHRRLVLILLFSASSKLSRQSEKLEIVL
jgi:hypothetical protein